LSHTISRGVDSNGRLRTRLLQVLKKDGAEWKIVVDHNVDESRACLCQNRGGRSSDLIPAVLG
jgi:hypothetical protein